DLLDDGSNSFATDLPSGTIDHKKYTRFSKTIEKKISREIRSLSPEYKKMFETSIFLCGEEKSSDLAEEKEVRRKSLQVQQHSKRTEVNKNLEIFLLFSSRNSKLCLHLPMSLHMIVLPVSAIGTKSAPFPRKAADSHGIIICFFAAFQDALKIFCRIKGGRVLIDEAFAVLDSMDIPINPEIFEEVIKHTYIDNNHKVDIGDIIFILNELQEQYEEVSIIEGSTLDEITSDKKLSSVAGCYLQCKKKNSLSSKLLEPSISKNHQYSSKIMEETDGLESKRSKHAWEIRKFLGGVGSSNVGVQKPYSKNGINFKKTFREGASLTKSLDKSSISSIPKLQKSAVRNCSSLLKQVSSMEKTALNALDNFPEAVSEPQENYFAAEGLQSILPSVGITLLDKEFQKIVTDTTRNENGMMKLDDFISALAKEQSVPGCNVLPGVIKAIDKIKDKNVDYEDLNTCLRNFGIYLSKPEFKKITELTEAGETEKVNLKEFIDTMMSNTECFSEKLLLPDAIEALDNLRKETMRVSDLWNTLSSLNTNLKKDEFPDALKVVTVDEGDKVQFEEFAKVVKNMRDATRLRELQEVVLAADLLGGDMITGKNLEDFLRNIGIKSPKEEVEKILQSDFVSEDNMVNIKDCMKALRDTQKISNYI
uniref:EF-hand calcium binding domain 13 n=1 Tax=Aotus nancymaae TaxID=37293 RepID=A0A2K5BZ94_AOTNA